jgi:hypothetical protein
LLRIDHEAQVRFALDELEPGEARGCARFLHNLIEQDLAGAGLADRRQRVLSSASAVRECRGKARPSRPALRLLG